MCFPITVAVLRWGNVARCEDLGIAFLLGRPGPAQGAGQSPAPRCHAGVPRGDVGLCRSDGAGPVGLLQGKPAQGWNRSWLCMRRV